jgi:D-alanyl-D-alanine carboxypeptidase
MTYSEPARTAARRTLSPVLAVLVVINAALIGLLVNQSLAPSSSSAASAIDVRQGDGHGAPVEADGAVPDDIRQGDRHGASVEADGVVDEADGLVPDGVTVFDDELPAVANLDPELLGALRQAATGASDDGVVFVVNSGWRSPEYQEQLLQEAISEYGSEEEAARWVATADTSPHVSGDAVDIGPSLATAWLSEHGADYGLCQTYGNEPWHYELRPEAIDDSCPPMYADPTHDPRMQP